MYLLLVRSLNNTKTSLPLLSLQLSWSWISWPLFSKLKRPKPQTLLIWKILQSLNYLSYLCGLALVSSRLSWTGESRIGCSRSVSSGLWGEKGSLNLVAGFLIMHSRLLLDFFAARPHWYFMVSLFTGTSRTFSAKPILSQLTTKLWLMLFTGHRSLVFSFVKLHDVLIWTFLLALRSLCDPFARQRTHLIHSWHSAQFLKIIHVINEEVKKLCPYFLPVITESSFPSLISRDDGGPSFSLIFLLVMIHLEESLFPCMYLSRFRSPGELFLSLHHPLHFQTTILIFLLVIRPWYTCILPIYV